jgi:hypothetical protein
MQAGRGVATGAVTWALPAAVANESLEMAKREPAVPARAEQRIEPELKRLRERAGLSLRTLGDEAGFSASFLSQRENGQVSRSSPRVRRIR